MIILIIKIAMSIIINFFAGPAAVWVFNHMPAKWLCDYDESPEERERLVGLPGTLTGSVEDGRSAGEAGKAGVSCGPEKRIKENPWRWVYAVGFICLCLRLSLADILDGFLEAQNQNPSTGPDSVEDGFARILSSAVQSDAGASAQLAIAGLATCWILLIIALADLKYMIIPDQFVLLLAVSAVGFTGFFKHMAEGAMISTGGGASEGATGGATSGWPGNWPGDVLGAFGQPLIGFAIGAGFMLICALAGRLIYKQQVFGFGDVKLCGAMGLVLGINGIIATMAASVIISGFVAAAGLAAGKYKPRQQKPLGPYLCGCAMAYIFIVMPIIL